MFITPPSNIASWSEGRLTEGYLQNRLGILQHALLHGSQVPTAETLTEAIRYIRKESGVALTPAQFSRLLDLYPYAKSKVADYGWGDTEVEEMVLDVVANAFLGTRWPLGVDDCDVNAFVARLRFAAEKALPLLD
ncbi:hypothetical protein ACXIVK_27995 [Paraburkholderia caledonica]|jgi:hypothetical protein